MNPTYLLRIIHASKITTMVSGAVAGVANCYSNIVTNQSQKQQLDLQKALNKKLMES